jgi:hypothetical protein
MPVHKKSRVRRAVWVVLGVIAFVIASCTAQENHVEDYAMSNWPEPEKPVNDRNMETAIVRDDRSVEGMCSFQTEKYWRC